MAKENSLTARICDSISKYGIWALVFLMPLFFLPWTVEVLDFNKQALLILLAFVSLFAWMVRVLILGKAQFSSSKINITAGILFLVYFLSALFSVYMQGSFWGWPQSTVDSLLSLIGVLLVYFLVSNTFSKKDVFISAIALCASAALALLAGLIQLFGLSIAPFDFAKQVSFNTVGSVGSLGFFAAIVLPISIALLILTKKWWKILFSAQIVLSALILILINYKIVWWPVVLGMALIIMLGVLKKNLFDARWMALPMFFLAVSLFFVILNPQIPGFTQKVNEIYLSHGASFKIDLASIKERPFFGSGPGTFNYNFSKFKDSSFSSGLAWNLNFSQASSKILNDLATTGVLGFLALLAMFGLPIFYVTKYFLSEKTIKGASAQEKEQSKSNWVLILGFSAALAVQTLACFLYNFNIVLNFIYFFVVACLIVLMAPDKKEYEIRSSSLSSLAITFGFTLAFIFGLGLLILGGQRYVAEINYFNGISLLQADKVDDGIKGVELAVKLNNSSDLYFRQLSQIYLVKAQQELQNANGTLSDEQKNKLQALVANAVNAGKAATDINPKSAANWSSRGNVYQTLYGSIADSEKWAISSYDEAIKLDPNNPYLFAQEGNVNFVSSLKATGDQKAQLLASAKEKLEKAVSLNSNYSNALYSLGLVYDELGDKDKAIEIFTKVQQLNPKDTNIPKILENLRASKPALQQPIPPKEALPAAKP